MLKKIIKRIWKPPKVEKVIIHEVDDFGISHHLGTKGKVDNKNFYIYE